MSILEEFQPLFHPTSVALVGASADPAKFGYHCLQSLLKGDFKGSIYPVNPSLKEVCGLKAYPSVKDIPDKVDLAIIIVATALVPQVLTECGEKGIKGVVLITAGFKEREESKGEEAQREIAAIANRYGIKVIGPNTHGMANLHANLDASFTPEFSLVKKGGVSLLSQSGGFCHLIAWLAIPENLPFSKIVGLGNRCNVDFADLLDYLEQDPDTKVVTLYIEGTDDARRLVQKARQVSRKKPMLALKSGVSSAKDQASQFHTGSLAGSYEINRAALRQAGIVMVDSSQEFVDAAKALLLCPLPRGKGVAIITGQAGPGILATDCCEPNGLTLARFSPRTQSRLCELLPPLSIRTNPVDMGPAWFDWKTCIKVVEAVLEDENVDALVLCAVYASLNEVLLRELCPLLKGLHQGKPVIVCFPSPPTAWEAERRGIESYGVPVYSTPERAVKALSALVRRQEIVAAHGQEHSC